MKTANDVIEDFKELADDQQEKVIEFVVSFVDQEKFSENVVQQLLQARKDDKEGINMSGPFRGREAIDYLTELENQAQT